MNEKIELIFLVVGSLMFISVILTISILDIQLTEHNFYAVDLLLKTSVSIIIMGFIILVWR